MTRAHGRRPATGLPVSAIAVRSDAPPAVTLEPDMAAYFGERASVTAPLDWASYSAATHRPLASVCADLLTALGDAALDVVTVAHEAPDSAPHLSVAGYLAESRSDHPLVVAVSDQGHLAPFTALRLAAAYRRRDTVRHAAVVAVREPAGPWSGGTVDGTASAVALLLGGTGTMALTGVYAFPGTSPSGAGEALVRALPGGGDEELTVLADAGFAVHLGGLAPHVDAHAPGDLWPALARRLTHGCGGTVLVAGHDHRVGGAAAALFTPVHPA